MPLIQWDKSLSVGVAEFDRQHQILIKLINDLNDAMLKRKGKDELGTVIVELKKYTQSHFTFEEKQLKQIAYPQLSHQEAEHAKFVKQLEEFEKELSEGSVGLSVAVINYLSKWLRSHILGEDAKYTAYCHEHGLR